MLSHQTTYYHIFTIYYDLANLPYKGMSPCFITTKHVDLKKEKKNNLPVPDLCKRRHFKGSCYFTALTHSQLFLFILESLKINLTMKGKITRPLC